MSERLSQFDKHLLIYAADVLGRNLPNSSQIPTYEPRIAPKVKQGCIAIRFTGSGRSMIDTLKASHKDEATQPKFKLLRSTTTFVLSVSHEISIQKRGQQLT